MIFDRRGDFMSDEDKTSENEKDEDTGDDVCPIDFDIIVYP